MPIKIETNPALDVMGDAGTELIAKITAAVTETPLTELLWKRVPGSDPHEYRWELNAADGRRWRQRIVFENTNPNPNAPGMTFNVDDHDPDPMWHESDFAPFREVRQAVIELRNSHALSLVDIAWT